MGLGSALSACWLGNLSQLEEDCEEHGHCSKKHPRTPVGEVQVPSPAKHFGSEHGSFRIPPSRLHFVHRGATEVVGHSQRFSLGLKVGVGFGLVRGLGRHCFVPWVGSERCLSCFHSPLLSTPSFILSFFEILLG